MTSGTIAVGDQTRVAASGLPPDDPDFQPKHGSLRTYLQSLLGPAQIPRGKSPVPLLTRRPSSPEEAPLLHAGADELDGEALSRSYHGSPVNSGGSSPRVPDQSERGPYSSSPRTPFIGYIVLLVLSSISIAAVPALVRLYWKGLAENQYCVDSLNYAYNTFTFAESNGSYWSSICQGTVRVTSMYAAAKVYCQPGDIEPGFAAIRDDCRARAGLDLLDLDKIAAIVTDDYIARLPIVDIDDAPPNVEFTEPVLISSASFSKVFKTIKTWHSAVRTHHTYGFLLYAFWAAVILGGISSNCYTSRRIRRRIQLRGDEESATYSNPKSDRSTLFARSIGRWVKTHIMTPAAFGTHHQRLLYWCTIPSRFDTIVISLFWALSITLSCISYTTFADNFFWPDTNYQLWRYISDRTGILSYASLVLIWVFATRNNGFVWATGWSYRSFNIYHRHVARVGTVLAIVHSIGYTYLYLTNGGFESYKEAMRNTWLLLGVVATVTMSALLAFSHAWIRTKFYESFLLLHIILSVVTLIGLFTHTSTFENYEHYLWPVVAVWSGDRFLRLVRIVYHNIRAKFSSEVVRITKSVASYDKISDVIRLEIRPALGFMPRPGQFYYIYQPSTWTGYENHPFTLGAWTTGDVKAPERYVRPMDNKDSQYQRSRISEDSINSHDEINDRLLARQESTSNDMRGTSLIFWVRPYDGWTKKLRDDCLKSANSVAHPLLLLEGPYGSTAPLHSYDTVLLIAGGTGIASAVPYILDHIARADGAEGGTRTTTIRLVWTARQKAFIEDVCSKELAPALQRPDFQASFFTTRPPSHARSSMLYDNLPPQGKSTSVDLSLIKISHQRPDIRSFISNTAKEERMTSGKTAVLVCGPAGMADEARAAVHEAMKEGLHSVDYFEEAFGW